MDIETLTLAVNTTWLVTAAALVFFMQAGFALLESGLVRSKNAVNVLMKNYVNMCFCAVVFWIIGYGLMFGKNPTGWFGSDGFMLITTSDWNYSVLLFQMMFATTTVTIVSGALAERIRYSAFIVSAIVVSGFIYAIFGSWAWGSLADDTTGWLRAMGFIDFAGSTVVHSVGGWTALAGVIVLGPRLGRFGKERRASATVRRGEIKSRYIPGHNLPLMAFGGFVLWLGFFGFNAGSLLQVDSSIGLIVLNTHLSGAGGVIGALLALKLSRRPVLMSFSINGGLGGLVAICASANVVEPGFALIIGLGAGLLVTLGVYFMERMKWDDAVGAVSVHGLAGFWGTIAVALFDPSNFFNGEQLKVQLIGAGAAFLWAFPLAFLMFKIIDLVMSLRVSTVDEQRGLDYTEHYEVGYPEFQRDFLHLGKDK